MIGSFDSWARTSLVTFGGAADSVLRLREDVDFITGNELRTEARRIAHVVLGLDAPAGSDAAPMR